MKYISEQLANCYSRTQHLVVYLYLYTYSCGHSVKTYQISYVVLYSPTLHITQLSRILEDDGMGCCHAMVVALHLFKIIGNSQGFIKEMSSGAIKEINCLRYFKDGLKVRLFFDINYKSLEGLYIYVANFSPLMTIP